MKSGFVLFVVILFLFGLNSVSGQACCPCCCDGGGGGGIPSPPSCLAVGVDELIRRVTSHQMMASSAWTSNFADYGRLHNPTAWFSGVNNIGQWIQVDLGFERSVCSVATQGRPIHAQWVKTYKIGYQRLSSDPIKYVDGGKIFTGNTDKDSVVKVTFTPVQARYIRIYPQTWYNHMSMRMEVYVDRVPYPELKTLGISEELRYIADSAMTASSTWSSSFPYNGRLNGLTAWYSGSNRKGQWLQVELPLVTDVAAIETQGRNGVGQWVRSFKLKYKVLPSDVFQWVDNGRLFYGNKDWKTVVRNIFGVPIKAKFIRVYPQTWNSHMSMRMELYKTSPIGAPVPLPPTTSLCLPIGVNIRDRRIKDSQMTASSSWSGSFPRYARIYRPDVAWYSGANTIGNWLQVDLGKQMTVCGVSTQGRPIHAQWVTKYKIGYKVLSSDPLKYVAGGKVFLGSRSKDSLQEVDFARSVQARFIRFYPQAWVNHMSMRVEVYAEQMIPSILLSFGVSQDLRNIPDNQMTASSTWSGVKPWNGRVRGNGWYSLYNTVGQWLQVELNSVRIVAGIETQGRLNVNQWVKSFKLQYRVLPTDVLQYVDNQRIFYANTNWDTIVRNTFITPVYAKYIRVLPQTWYGHMSMRMELLTEGY